MAVIKQEACPYWSIVIPCWVQEPCQNKARLPRACLTWTGWYESTNWTALDLNMCEESSTWVAWAPSPHSVYNSAEAEHSIILSNADLENFFLTFTVGSSLFLGGGVWAFMVWVRGPGWILGRFIPGSQLEKIYTWFEKEQVCCVRPGITAFLYFGQVLGELVTIALDIKTQGQIHFCVFNRESECILIRS